MEIEDLNQSKGLGWEEVQVEVKEVKDGEEELLLIHFNKQE